MKNEKAKRRTIWSSNELDKKAEEIRRKIGLGHSNFHCYAIVEVIKQFTIVTTGEAPKQ